jgi:hypothetical protein
MSLIPWDELSSLDELDDTSNNDSETEDSTVETN